MKLLSGDEIFMLGISGNIRERVSLATMIGVQIFV